MTESPTTSPTSRSPGRTPRPALRTGRVVWITGASSGIGRATAHACARRGDRLVLTSRSAEVLEQVRAECEAAGSAGVLVAPADVRDDAQVQAAAAAGMSQFGAIDVVVQAAGVAAYGRIEDVPLDVLDGLMATNVLGATRVARTAVKRFREQGHGTLVVVGSVLGRLTVPYLGVYTSSKFALRGIVRTIQQEVRDAPGVDVVLFAPGGVDTPIYDQAATVFGRRNRPPFPVASPERSAAKILHAVERPHREVDIGWANPLMRIAFTATPAVFDALASPAMRLMGFRPGRRSAGPGNVLAPQPQLEGVHQARAGTTRRHGR